MTNKIIRVISRAANGTLRIKEFEDFSEISGLHDQIGVDDCSTDLSLRGMPLFRGLIGPIPESKTVVCYESPDVFEFMTKEWAQAKPKRRRRSKTTTEKVVAADSSASPATPKFVQMPNLKMGDPTSSPLASL